MQAADRSEGAYTVCLCAEKRRRTGYSARMSGLRKLYDLFSAHLPVQKMFRIWLLAMLCAAGIVCLTNSIYINSAYASSLKKQSSPKLCRTKLSINSGKSAKLKVKNYKGKVRWRSSNPYVAKVSKKGVVRAKHRGYAVIFALLGDKNDTRLKCRVTVTGSGKEKAYIFCRETDISGKMVVTGGSFHLAVMGGAGRTWTWKVSDPNLVLLEKKGSYVSSLKRAGRKDVIIKTFMGHSGTVTITAKSGSKKLRFKLKIHAAPQESVSEKLRKDVLAKVIKPGMKAQEKCLAVAKWMSGYVSYKLTNAGDYSLLMTRKGQCYHYARTYVYLMEKAGIPCDFVSTKTHAWNQVKIDGAWYNIDVSSFDTDSNYYPYEYKHFLVSDKAFWRKEARLRPYHTCTGTRYDNLPEYDDSPWVTGDWKKY